ncbi:hypothetical protein HK096_006946, partial [Nowakowskiella sp. JEL0078]
MAMDGETAQRLFDRYKSRITPVFSFDVKSISIIVKNILPKFHPVRNILLGGLDKNIILFDCDDRFCISRLQTVDDNERLLDSIIEQLTIIKPKSTKEFIEKIPNLSNVIRNREVSAILVDSISTFFWIDKCDPKGALNQSVVLRMLQDLAREWALALFIVRWDLFPGKETRALKIANIRLIFKLVPPEIYPVYSTM